MKVFDFNKLNRPAILSEYKDEETCLCTSLKEDNMILHNKPEMVPLLEKIETIKQTIKPTKQSEGKLFYEIDWEFIEGMATRMALNKQNGKYDRFGWRDQGVDIGEMNQALVRHLIAILKGELQDDEQQYSHYYALACNSMLIVNSLKSKNEVK